MLPRNSSTFRAKFISWEASSYMVGTWAVRHTISQCSQDQRPLPPPPPPCTWCTASWMVKEKGSGLESDCEWWNIGEGILWGYSQSWCFKHPQNSFVPLHCCYVWPSLTPFPPYTLRQLLDLWMAIYSLWDHQATHKSHADHNSGTPGELVIVSTMPNCCVYGLCTLTPQLSPYQTISDRRLSN